MSHGRDEPAGYQVVCNRHDGNASRCLLRGARGFGSSCEDNIRPCARQLDGHRLQRRRRHAGAAVIDIKIAALHNSAMAEFVQDGRPYSALARRAGQNLARRAGQNRDAVAPPGFLRPSDGQRGQYGYPGDTQDELAASHRPTLNKLKPILEASIVQPISKVKRQKSHRAKRHIHRGFRYGSFACFDPTMTSGLPR
jgi:hypothetical protein